MAATSIQNSLNMTNIPTLAQTELNQVQNHRVILAVNCVVLIIAATGLIQMWVIRYDFGKKLRSATFMAVLNLIFTHFIYFLTVPFRIYYYAVDQWYLTVPFCKVVSSMIFIHMYMSFIFYVIIIVTRLLSFRQTPVNIYRSHWIALACVVVWLIVLVVVPCILCLKYASTHVDDSKCFHFANSIGQEMGAMAFNYVTSLVIIVVTLVLAALQTVVQVKVWRDVSDWRNHQEFWQQVKSSLFVLIMVVCFLPYAAFRLHYIENLEQEGLKFINEVFLSLTTLNCVDMFTFVKFRCLTCCERA